MANRNASQTGALIGKSIEGFFLGDLNDTIISHNYVGKFCEVIVSFKMSELVS